MHAGRHRRAFMLRTVTLAACSTAAALHPQRLLAQSTTVRQIPVVRGDVRVNGDRVRPDHVIRAGDTVTTGEDGFILFTIQQDAIFLRSRSELRIGAADESIVVSSLRLVTGAIGAVFGRGRRRTVHTPTVTAGIRGTGIYAEAIARGTYFCTCYGTVVLETPGSAPERILIESTRHSSPQLVPDRPGSGDAFVPATFETHTDDEMDALERAVGRRVPWRAQ